MKKIINIFKIASFTLLLTAINSCKGDDFVINTDLSESNIYEASAPLIKYYKATLADAIEHIEDKRIFVDDEGVVNFSVTKDVDIVWDDLAKMKDVDFQRSYLMSEYNQGGDRYKIVEDISLNEHEDARYDSAYIAHGILRLSFDVPVDYKGDINITLPQFYPTITRSFYADGNNTDTYDFAINTQGHTLRFAHDDTYSLFNMILESDFEAVGDINDNLIMKYEYRNVEADGVFGYFGNRTAELKDQTQSIDEIKDILEYISFELQEIKYSLSTTNYIGAPFDLYATNIRFYDSSDNDDFKILKVEGNSEIKVSVESPKYNQYEIIPIYGEVTVDSKNSNVLDIANPFPEEIIADIVAVANPNGENVNKPNYYTGRDTLFAELEIKAPLMIKINEFTRKDTIDFDFRDLADNKRENIDFIDMANIYINIYNFLPFDMGANLYVIDERGVKLDDIFKDFKQILKSGDIVNGRLVDPETTEIVVELTKDKVLTYFDKSAKSIVLETKTSTINYNTDYVKIYDNYGIGAKISAEVKSQIPDIY